MLGVHLSCYKSPNCFERAHSHRFISCGPVCRTSVLKTPQFYIKYPKERLFFLNHKHNLTTSPLARRAGGPLECRYWTTPVLNCSCGLHLTGPSSQPPHFRAWPISLSPHEGCWMILQYKLIILTARLLKPCESIAPNAVSQSHPKPLFLALPSASRFSGIGLCLHCSSSHSRIYSQ